MACNALANSASPSPLSCSPPPPPSSAPPPCSICMYTHIHTCVCMYTHIHTYVYTCMKYVYLYILVYTYTHTDTHTDTQTHTHNHTHAHTHTHTHTYLRAHVYPANTRSGCERRWHVELVVKKKNHLFYELFFIYIYDVRADGWLF